MGRLIDVDNIEYYLEEDGSAVAFKEDIEQIPSAQSNTHNTLQSVESVGDTISRQAAIDSLNEVDDGASISTAITVVEEMPSAQPELIRCKDCKWWDKTEDSPFGYCMAMKHGYMSTHWEIGIYRLYKGDFYCADAERRTDG